MKRFQAIFLALVLALAVTSLAVAAGTPTATKGEKPGAVVVDVTQLSATVKAIDLEKKMVTLEGKNGKIVTLNAKNARNLDQVKVGDKVKVDYIEELAVYVTKSGTPREAEATQTVALAPKGAMPGGMVTNTIELQATVEKIDYKKRTVTLKGPEGKVRTFKVSTDVKRFKEVKKGDQVNLRYTEAFAINVVRP